MSKTHWVQVATKTQPPLVPPVVVIYTASLSHAEADRLADLLRREGFPGQVVVWLGGEK